MEQIINNSTTWAQLVITTQSAQFSPVIERKDLDTQLIIVEADRPVELIIDAYTL